VKTLKEAERPVIVVRKRRKEPRRHQGGNWKVAYADFVTAMMAFFLVMWIMGMDQDSRELVQGYFTNPSEVGRGSPLGAGASSASPLPPLGWASQAERNEFLVDRGRMGAVLASLELRLGEAGLGDEGMDVEMALSVEGIRIDLMETRPDEALFDRGGSDLTAALGRVLAMVGSEIRSLPNDLIVEGHTDRTPFVSSSGYGNWELSTDRAHAVRRRLEAEGIPPERIREVRGYGDRRPRVEADPYDPRNRRVSLVLPFLATPPAPPESPLRPSLPWREARGEGS